MVKSFNYNFNLIKASNIFIRFEIFNPFKRRRECEITPKVELIPRIGVGIALADIDGTNNSLHLSLGLFNISLDISFYKWKIIKY